MNTILSQYLYNQFIDWMHRANLDHKIITLYQQQYRHPVLRAVMNDYFRIRLGDVRHPHESAIGYRYFRTSDVLSVRLVEVLPTDRDAKFCQIERDVVARFQLYLTARFGKRIQLHHEIMTLNYDQTFGDIFYTFSAMFNPYPAPSLAQFMEQFEPPCLIRFGAETINGQSAAMIYNVARCAVFLGREFRLVDTIKSFDYYAHEFGHNIGLDHLHVDPANPPRDRINRLLLRLFAGKRVGIDDIMVKTQPVRNAHVGRFVSPLVRFALEPESGYIDQFYYGRLYSSLYT